MNLACPSCHVALIVGDGDVSCPSCHQTWPIIDGLARFMEIDPKYERAQEPWDRGGPGWKLPFVDGGITWWFHRRLPAGGRVLDVGCGAGLRFLAGRHEMFGINSSAAPLRAARRHYREVSVANLLAIPYPDDFFDAVVSVDVLEHIPAEVKDQALKEMIRVTRTGGRLVHIQDLDSQKPLHLWARRKPELFQKYFVDQMGHYGLETASRALGRLRSLDLRLAAWEATNRSAFQLPENYAWQFDNEYRTLSPWVHALTSLSYRVRRYPVLRAACSGFYQLIWTRTVERLFPVDWAFNLAFDAEVTTASKAQLA